MTIDQQINCLKKEIDRRKRTYPKLVTNGEMTEETAAFQISSMQAAFETLAQLKGLVYG